MPFFVLALLQLLLPAELVVAGYLIALVAVPAALVAWGLDFWEGLSLLRVGTAQLLTVALASAYALLHRFRPELVRTASAGFGGGVLGLVVLWMATTAAMDATDLESSAAVLTAMGLSLVLWMGVVFFGSWGLSGKGLGAALAAPAFVCQVLLMLVSAQNPAIGPWPLPYTPEPRVGAVLFGLLALSWALRCFQLERWGASVSGAALWLASGGLLIELS